jgi:hypothetical protein
MTRTSIESILDKHTIDAIRGSRSGTCVILDSDAGLQAIEPLSEPRTLSSDQLSELQELILDPASWFSCVKRCLPRNTAEFRLERSISITIGMSCLTWDVTGSGPGMSGFFDPVAGRMRELVKSLFPEYASSLRRSMWRSGVIAQLRSVRSQTLRQDD